MWNHGVVVQMKRPTINPILQFSLSKNVPLFLLVFLFANFAIANPEFTDRNLKITSFTGFVEECEIKLSWGTTHEIGNAYFEVERSFDSQRFFPIGKVNGSGNSIKPSNYYYKDDNIFKENYFYRLKAVDFNGDFIYSDIIKISTSCKREGVTIDNISMTKRNWMKVHVFTDIDLEKAQIIIANKGDKALIKMFADIKPGMNLILIDSAGLEPDTYEVKIKYDKRIITTKKFDQQAQ